MELMSKILASAKSDRKKIVLPEGNEIPPILLSLMERFDIGFSFILLMLSNLT